jgi:hypothetical protein
VVRTTWLICLIPSDIKYLALDRDVTEATIHSCIHASVSFPVPAEEESRGKRPLHCERKSLEIGSLFGGLSCTGVLGSNLPAIPRGILGCCLVEDVIIVVDDVKEELSG